MAEKTLSVIPLIYRETFLKDKTFRNRCIHGISVTPRRAPVCDLSFVAPMKSKKFHKNNLSNNKFYRDSY